MRRVKTSTAKSFFDALWRHFNFEFFFSQLYEEFVQQASLVLILSHTNPDLDPFENTFL
jgi:hypothetical protein